MIDDRYLEQELTQVVRAPNRWRRRLLKTIKVVAITMSSMLVLAAGGGFAYWRYLESIAPPPISFEEVVPGTTKPRPAPSGNALNFLILGSDSRDRLSDQELSELGTETVGGRRTDTIILVHLSADRKKTVLVSFPRDSWVNIPGYGMGKINTAFGKGRAVEDGANLMRATLEDLTRLRIDHYIEVDFRGFLDVVDAIGGVEVCLSRAANDPMAGLYLDAGRHTVRGVQALAFVRARHFDPRSDFGRIERQQQFLAAMMRKATSTGVLLNPLKLNDMLTSGMRSVRRDEKLGLDDLRALAGAMKGLDPKRVSFVTAPVRATGPQDTSAGTQSVVRLDEEAGDALWEAIRADKPLPGTEGYVAPSESPSPSPSPTSTFTGPYPTANPDDVVVRVLNGSGVKGAAGKMADQLRGNGLGRVTPITTGDADRDDYPTTLVRFGPNRETDARTVLQHLQGAQLEFDEDLTEPTVFVVVGRDYAGTPDGAASPSASPSPSKRPPRTGIAPAPDEVHTADEDPCA